MAERFRDEGRDVLLFVDNIYRYTLAGTGSISTSRSYAFCSRRYQPTLAGRNGVLQERITSTKASSITSVQAVYVPADDLTDPLQQQRRSLRCNGSLNRNIASMGLYPAIDPLQILLHKPTGIHW